MSIDLTQWDRNFRRGLLIFAVLFGVLDYMTGGTNQWLNAGFVITVAGLVGYFTNFLAIKMLFQPKQGQVFGWRGLVPKNKAQIARSLGESVQEQLLSPDIILAYISERRLIEMGTQNAGEWLDRKIHDPEVRNKITQALVEFLNQQGGELMTAGFDLAEESLHTLARNPKAIEATWQQVRGVVLQFLQSDANRTRAAEQLQTVLQQHLPDIADWLNRALEGYLHNKRALGTLGLGLKSMISFDRIAIENVLKQFIEEPQLSDELMGMLDTLTDAIQDELNSDKTQALIHERLESWITRLGDLSRKNFLPAAIEYLKDYLKDESNWKQIETLLMKILARIKDRAVALLNSDQGRTYLRTSIERVVHKLNVTELVEEQVQKLDTDELEKMVLDNTGGNLTVIQVLGGVLGIIAGTVQVHLAFAIPVGGAVGLVWVAYYLNERKTQAK